MICKLTETPNGVMIIIKSEEGDSDESIQLVRKLKAKQAGKKEKTEESGDEISFFVPIS